MAMGTLSLVPQSGITLYSQLASVLRGRITRGEWPVGHEIPTLDELCAQYGVARVSARQAILLLVAEGLLSSHRGRRTRVVGLGVHSRTLSTGVAAPLEQVPDYSAVVIDKDERAMLPPAVARLGKAERSYVRIRKVDREAGVPYSVSDIYVPRSLYRRFRRDAEQRSKLSQLVRDATTVPIVSARERIMVSSADVEEARALACPLSAPVARVQRIFADADGRIVYAGWSVYRGDRFVVERELTELVHPGSPRSASPGRRVNRTSAGRAPSRR